MAFGFLLFPPGSSVGNIFPHPLYALVRRNSTAVNMKDFGLVPRRTKFEKTTIKIYRGDRESYAIQVISNDEPFDLSDYTIHVQIRKTHRTTETYLDDQIIDGQNTNAFDEGKLVWIIPASVTAELPIKCVYDIEARRIGDPNEKFTIIGGNIEVDKDVTR